MPSVDYSAVKAWRISDFSGIDKLALKTTAIQPPKRGQVAVRVHAVSLNYRDLIIALGKSAASLLTPLHPLPAGHSPPAHRCVCLSLQVPGPEGHQWRRPHPR